MTISELEEASGVSRRTIHYYVKEGVLPPPDGRGGGARYSEEHLWRLTLIRDLQRSHLKLAGIKEELDGLELDEMKEIAQLKLKEQSGLGKKQRSVAFNDTYTVKSVSEHKRTEIDSSLSYLKNNYSFLDWDTNDDVPGKTKKRSTYEKVMSGISSQSKSKKEIWQRIQVAEGIELSIREDVLGSNEKSIEQILREIRKKIR